MRLLQINVCVNVGSTGRIAEQIGLVAMDNGWESYIAYGQGRSTANSRSKLISVGNKLDVLCHGLITRLFDKHGLGSMLATRKLVKEIRKIHPDIVHLHNIHGYYLNYKVLFDYLQRENIPVVWTMHDCWSFTGHCAYFTFAKCNKWKQQCVKCPLVKVYPASIFIDNSSSNFLEKKRAFTSIKNLTLVPVSNWLAGFIPDSFLHKCSVSVIHNGIDLDVFRPSNVKIEDDALQGKRILLGVASPWSPRKGLLDFVRLRSMFGDDIVFVLIGLTTDQIGSLPEGIIGIERTSSVHILAQWYSMADVFLNLTYDDNFPTTNLEALACGTPVITYRTGGSPEAVTAETGLVVEQGNMEQLQNAIITVLDNGKNHYSAACRKRAEEFFDKDKCYQRYIDLYNEILENK